MTLHGSALAQEETPHETETIQITISDAVRRRAHSLINNRTIDASARAFIRYTLEINDPYLAELVRRVEAGESIVHNTRDLDDLDGRKKKADCHPRKRVAR